VKFLRETSIPNRPLWVFFEADEARKKPLSYLGSMIHDPSVHQVHLNAIGATLCFLSDHRNRTKPVVPDGCDLDVTLTV